MEAAIKKPEGFQPKDIIAMCLVAFTALALFPLAPKLGRGLTAVVLILMVATLWYPAWQMTGKIKWNRRISFTVAMAAISALHFWFGVYVWPPIPRHPLTAEERTLFENALKAQKGDDIEIQIGCSPNDEKACTYAGQFIRPIGDSGWKVQAYVSRLMLTKPLDGIMIYRRGGNRDYSLQHYDAGGYFNISEPHLFAMQRAFQSIQIEPSGG